MKQLFIIAMLLLAGGSLMAQQSIVNVTSTSGERTEITLGAEGVMVINGDNLDIRNSDGGTVQFNMDAIRHITFSEGEMSISEAPALLLSVYPNPTSGLMRISGIGSVAKEVNIFNLEGRKVMSGRYADGATVDLSKLSSGIYLMQCGKSVTKISKM